MELKIIDNSGVRMNFEFEYRNVLPKLDFNQTISEIKSSFKTQFQKVESLFPKEEVFFHVNLELESSHGNHILGLFDAEHSSTNIFYFRIYYETIKQLIDKKIYASDEFYEYDDTILHEIIHAADYQSISKTDGVEAINNKIKKNAVSDSYFNLNNQSTQNPFNWTVVHIIERFRNEGIAVLGEKLLGDNPEKSMMTDIEEITNQFKNVLEFCIETSESIDLIHSFSQKNELYQLLNKSSSQAYVYGHIILLLVLALQNEDEKEIILNALDYLLGDVDKKPSHENCLKILKLAINTDVSDYINGLLLEPFYHHPSSIIDKQLILNFCTHIQGESNNEAIQILNENSFTTVYEKFLELMKITVGYQMTIEELQDYSTKFKIENNSDDIKKCIQSQVDYLMPLAVNQKNEIAIWALTYLFDEEELIYDSIPFFGYQDDWLVLSAAIRLIKSNINT